MFRHGTSPLDVFHSGFMKNLRVLHSLSLLLRPPQKELNEFILHIYSSYVFWTGLRKLLSHGWLWEWAFIVHDMIAPRIDTVRQGIDSILNTISNTSSLKEGGVAFLNTAARAAGAL